MQYLHQITFALSPPEPAAFPKRDVRRFFAVMVGSAPKESQRNELNRLFAVKNGGRGRARTGDPLLAKQVLSQLSYTPTVGVTFILKHLRRFQNSFLRFWVIPVPKLYKTPVYGGQLRLANQHFISSAVLPHGQQFLIDPQACLREHAHD